MTFDVELTVSTTGQVKIEAIDIEDARKKAEQITAVVTVTFHGPVDVNDDDFDESSFGADVEVEGVFDVEEDEPAEANQ